MKKAWLALIVLFFLAACGNNELDLDIEKVQEIVAEEVVKGKGIKSDGYTSDDIQLVKICEAMERGKEDYGYDGYYILYWQTNDKKYQEKIVMKDYELSYGTNLYSPIEDRCIEFE